MYDTRVISQLRDMEKFGEAYYTPVSNINVILVSKLMRTGFQVEIGNEDKKMLVKKNGDARFQMKKNLFILEEDANHIEILN